MTAQMMDECEFRGEQWTVCEWHGNSADAVPSSESLGFRTVMEHTANYRGRIDRFAVREMTLKLVAIRATMAPGCENVVPSGATVQRDDTRTVRVEFADFTVPFTGELVLGTEFDENLYVHAGVSPANRFRRRAILAFVDGRLIGERFETGSYPDAAFDVV